MGHFPLIGAFQSPIVRSGRPLAKRADLCYPNAILVKYSCRSGKGEMIDISSISLKKKLEQERTLIPLVAQVWEVPAPAHNDGNTITLIIKHMQNAHAARSVWEALSPQERLCLFYLLASGNPDKPKGIMLESLRKKTKLSSEMVEDAVESLRTRWYLVDAG